MGEFHQGLTSRRLLHASCKALPSQSQVLFGVMWNRKIAPWILIIVCFDMSLKLALGVCLNAQEGTNGKFVLDQFQLFDLCMPIENQHFLCYSVLLEKIACGQRLYFTIFVWHP